MSDQPGWTPPTSGAAPDAPPPPGWSPQQPPPAPPPPAWGGYGPASGPAPGGPGWGAGWTPRPAAPKPGVIPLRPLGVGEILDGAISTIRAHPRVMLGLSAVVVVASQVLQVALTFTALRDLGQASLALDPAASPDQALGTMLTEVSRAAVGLLLTSAVQGLAMIVLTGMLTVVVSRAVLAERLTAGQAWQFVRPQLPRLLGLTLLTGLVVVLAVTLPLLPAVLAAVAGAPGVVVGLLVLLGLPAGVVTGAWLYVKLAMAPPALVLERATVRTALGRSWELVRAGWWRVFGILLLAAVIGAVISGIVQVPFTLVGEGLALATGSPDATAPQLLALSVAGLGGAIAGTVVFPFSAAVAALVYVDLRMRREGLDLELARAAGAAPPPGPAPSGQPPAGQPPDGASGGPPPPAW